MLVGNVCDVAGATPLQNMMGLARQYGPIFQLDIAGRTSIVVVSGFSLVDEVCDDRRFDKSMGAALRHIRAFAGDGLFTSTEPRWSEMATQGAAAVVVSSCQTASEDGVHIAVTFLTDADAGFRALRAVLTRVTASSGV
jgi:hypothetical protein